ncbi:MAG: hypothetical protein RBS13_06460 [Bacteroidales bacterium]|jgi:uncharacterized integral membrane protein|nr:hypothetical protein [Bacteroidales bacterium]
MRNVLLILSILIFTSSLYGQEVKCPFNELDCKGKCGLFCDTNTDSYCDHSVLCNVKKMISEKLSNTNNDTNTIQAKIEIICSDTNIAGDKNAAMQPSTEIESENVPIEDAARKKPYHLISILISVLVLYVITLLLVKKRIIKQVFYRKIWNIALTISFLVSGLLGLLIAFFINYSYVPDYYLDLMTLHVDFGIAMALIAFFHALWHLNYYKHIFKKSKSKKIKSSI